MTQSFYNDTSGLSWKENNKYNSHHHYSISQGLALLDWTVSQARKMCCSCAPCGFKLQRGTQTTSDNNLQNELRLEKCM